MTDSLIVIEHYQTISSYNLKTYIKVDSFKSWEKINNTMLMDTLDDH